MACPTTPEEIKAEARELAAIDLHHHRTYGVDLNPFSTDSAREEWQRGFDNAGHRLGWSVDYARFYQRGRAAAELLETE